MRSITAQALLLVWAAATQFSWSVFSARTDIWAPPNWIGKLSQDASTTIYCGGAEAYKQHLCQNREYVINKLFAADMLGYCKYDWWTRRALGSGRLAANYKGMVPGFDADFTNVATSENTYLYAVRRLRVEAASDVWLCSDEECTQMQDVGLVEGGRNNSDLLVFTAASYISGTMVALPLAGKRPGVGTACKYMNASTSDGFSVDVKDYGVCFADKKDVIGPSNATFVPVVVPAYPAAAGVDSDFGPYGRLMVGTFMTDEGCKRLVLPRHAWLLQHGWDKQHGCALDKGDQSLYIFITYFIPGWAELKSPQASKLLKPTKNNMDSWLKSLDTYWWRYARVYYCDDDAMSSAYSGARCSVQDLSAEMVNLATNATRDTDNWLLWLLIEGIPVLVYPTYPSKTIAGPGRLGEGETDYSNLEDGTNNVNASHVARWLFSADMLARDNTTVVPWCLADQGQLIIYGSDGVADDDPVINGANGTIMNIVRFINDTSTLTSDAATCELLDSKGWLTLRNGTKPMEPFHTVLSPGLVAWQPYSGQTDDAQNLGFAGQEVVPPQAITRAMLEAVQIVQEQAQALADRLISTADMTATGPGAALNLYAFTMLAVVVLGTAADMVAAFREDVFKQNKRWQIWLLFVLPPVVFVATLLPAPVLALLQEINARKNNPDGSELEVGFTQVIARGYGDYRLLVVTVYRSVALYQSVTLVCAWVALVLASIGTVIATGYAWQKT